MQTRRGPPTRTSMFATGIRAPVGPYQDAKCSGSVHIRQTTGTGASKLRSITTAGFEVSSVIVIVRLSRGSEAREVVVHPLEARFPDRSVLLGPGRDLLEPGGV